MRIKISLTGQVTFFPERERDIFALGKLAERMKKGEAYVRWEHVYDKNVIGRFKGAQARDLLSSPNTHTLQSLTLSAAVLIQCIKTHLLKEVY